eukprot:m.304165 g.304165  ORF g.304165 m.304165 type:complete len:86 (-) comp16604_c0_seq1:271-528(-)
MPEEKESLPSTPSAPVMSHTIALPRKRAMNAASAQPPPDPPENARGTGCAGPAKPSVPPPPEPIAPQDVHSELKDHWEHSREREL